MAGCVIQAVLSAQEYVLNRDPRYNRAASTAVRISAAYPAVWVDPKDQ